MAPAPPRAGPPGVHLGLLPKLQEVGNVWSVQCVSFVCPCNTPGRGQAWALPAWGVDTEAASPVSQEQVGSVAGGRRASPAVEPAQ